MDDIVAVAVELEDGTARYFLTWGRIQHVVDPAALEQIVLEHATRFDLGAIPIKARLCRSLQDAAHEPYFYECFFEMCQQKIPFGDNYSEWKSEMDEEMRDGRELFYLGRNRHA